MKSDIEDMIFKLFLFRPDSQARETGFAGAFSCSQVGPENDALPVKLSLAIIMR
jgi:hypothetical protein